MFELTARECGSEGRWRKLVEVNRDYTPCVKKKLAGTQTIGEVKTYSLDEELKHESGCCKTSEFVRKYPSWDQTGADECSNTHRTPTADPLREIADDGATDAGASLHQNTRC
jgi:hypothetical protein